MSNVFKKLIRKEFGEGSYDTYFYYYHKKLDEISIDNKEVFEDIYLRLREYDFDTISKMNDRLNDTLITALRIIKGYFLIPFVYIISVIFLLIGVVEFVIAVPAIILISFCFVYKSYEYIVNKYCYIDARIVLVYKSVLEVLLLKKAGSKA